MSKNFIVHQQTLHKPQSAIQPLREKYWESQRDQRTKNYIRNSIQITSITSVNALKWKLAGHITFHS